MKPLRQVLKVFVLLLFLLVLFCYAIIFNNRAGWVAVSFLVLFLLVDFLSILPWIRWLKISGQGKVWTEVGQVFQLDVILKSSWLFWVPLLKISLPELGQQVQVFNWYFGQKKRLNFSGRATKRGVTEKVAVLFEASDLFGFFSKTYRQEICLEIVTMPAKQPAANQLAKRIIQQQQLSNFGETTADIKGFRSYRSGDAFKKVDWKVSARTQELIVKEYEQTNKSQLSLIFWGAKDAEFEEMLSYFYTLVQILQASQGLEIVLVGATVSVGNEIGENYAKLQPIISEVELPPMKGRQILIFTPKRPDEQLQNQLVILRQVNQVAVYDLEQLKRSAAVLGGGGAQ